MGKLLLSALSAAVLAGCASPTPAKNTTAAQRATRSFRIRSRCYYLDEASAEGSAGGSGGCGEPTVRLTLNGNDDLLVGIVSAPATWVRVTAGPDRLGTATAGNKVGVSQLRAKG